MGQTMTVADVGRLMDTTPTAMALLEGTERLVAANQAMADLLGADEARKLVGRSPMDFVPPEWVQDTEHVIRDTAAGLIITSTRNSDVQTLEGRAVSVNGSGSRFELAEGVFVLVALSPKDQPLESGSLPMGATLAIVVTDHDWRVTHLTTTARDLLGGDDVIGAGLFGIIQPSDIGALAAAVTQVDGGRAALSLRTKVHSGGEWHPVVMHLSTLCHHSPARLVCLMSDPDNQASGRGLPRNADGVAALLGALREGRLVSDVGMVIEGLSGAFELTAQQWEIIARSLRGQTAAEISRQMFLGRGTVRNALAVIYRRFGVHSQVGLVSKFLTTPSDPPQPLERPGEIADGSDRRS